MSEELPLPIRTRRRGTAIITNRQGGILVVEEKNGMFLLPGGGCDAGESRRAAACRELVEETGLQALNTQFLFRYLEEGADLYEFRGKMIQNHHTVFRVWVKGTPQPSHEIAGIRWWYPGDEINLSPASDRIIQKFLTQR